MKGVPGREQLVIKRGSRARIAATSRKLLEDGMAEISALSAANNMGITTLVMSICMAGAWV